MKYLLDAAAQRQTDAHVPCKTQIPIYATVANKYYRLTEDEFTKDLRTSVKGRIVFASFYGAGYESIATSMGIHH